MCLISNGVLGQKKIFISHLCKWQDALLQYQMRSSPPSSSHTVNELRIEIMCNYHNERVHVRIRTLMKLKIPFIACYAKIIPCLDENLHYMRLHDGASFTGPIK